MLVCCLHIVLAGIDAFGLAIATNLGFEKCRRIGVRCVYTIAGIIDLALYWAHDCIQNEVRSFFAFLHCIYGCPSHKILSFVRGHGGYPHSRRKGSEVG